jgi:hypothetical protein
MIRTSPSVSSVVLPSCPCQVPSSGVLMYSAALVQGRCVWVSAGKGQKVCEIESAKNVSTPMLVESSQSAPWHQIKGIAKQGNAWQSADAEWGHTKRISQPSDASTRKPTAPGIASNLLQLGRTRNGAPWQFLRMKHNNKRALCRLDTGRQERMIRSCTISAPGQNGPERAWHHHARQTETR